MFVPVMQIRPVRMRVLDRLMLVPVRMGPFANIFVVLMAVMLIIMAVNVFVQHLLVKMLVQMPFSEEGRYRWQQEQYCQHLKDRKRFPQENGGKNYSPERGAGKNELATGSSEVLRRCYIKHNADPVTKYAH